MLAQHTVGSFSLGAKEGEEEKEEGESLWNFYANCTDGRTDGQTD